MGDIQLEEIARDFAHSSCMPNPKWWEEPSVAVPYTYLAAVAKIEAVSLDDAPDRQWAVTVGDRTTMLYSSQELHGAAQELADERCVRAVPKLLDEIDTLRARVAELEKENAELNESVDDTWAKSFKQR